MRRTRRGHEWAKRVLDILGSVIGLVVLAPVIVVGSLAVAIRMGRPIFFSQPRPGRGGRIFTIYKFRTMRPADEGETWFRTDRQRVTRLGQLMRATSIDELPELWNVLRGDMSLVGPRPLLVEYLPKYNERESRRHEVRPGITGWAQVNGRQTITFSKRLELDVWYVDNWSIWLDLKILAMTVLQVFRPAQVISGQEVDEVDDIGLSADRQRRDAQEETRR